MSPAAVTQFVNGVRRKRYNCLMI